VNNSIRKNARLLAAIAVGSAALFGCASRADLMQIRDVQGQMRAAMADQNQDIEELRRRFEVLQSRMGDGKGGAPGRAQPSDQAMRWIDDLSRRVTALEQAQGSISGGPGGPILVPGEGGLVPPAVPVPPPGGGQIIMPTPVAATSSPLQMALAREQSSLAGTQVDPEYSAALAQIRGGDCKQAVSSLRNFVRKGAKSPLADNAQYWIGGCYYQEKDFNRAIIELNEVLLKYPKGDKVPAALLLLADAFKESGDSIDARLILQKLISDHPGSEEAQLGKSKLQALGE
jgi:tol-pal system protein YbgF